MLAEFQRITAVNLVDSTHNMLHRDAESLVRLARDSAKDKPAQLTSALTAVMKAKASEAKRGIHQTVLHVVNGNWLIGHWGMPYCLCTACLLLQRGFGFGLFLLHFHIDILNSN